MERLLTRMPSFNNSPRMRSVPERGFSFEIRPMSAFSSALRPRALRPEVVGGQKLIQLAWLDNSLATTTQCERDTTHHNLTPPRPKNITLIGRTFAPYSMKVVIKP